MDGLLKVALDVDLLAQLHKHTGHPRVLTDRQFFPLRKLQIVPQQAQGLFGKRPGLSRRVRSRAETMSGGR